MVKFVHKTLPCHAALEEPAPVSPNLPIVLVAAACLVDADGRILLAQRPEGKKMAGLWEFPGGKVDEGETPEFALMRELEEELGLSTRPCCFAPIAFASHQYDDFHLLMPLFVCRVWEGSPQSKEGQQIKWVRKANLMDYDMPEADIPLVSQIQAAL